MTEMVVVQCTADWEGIYVGGSKVCSNHMGGCWPRNVVDAVDENDVDVASRINVSMAEGVRRLPSDLDVIYESDDYEIME